MAACGGSTAAISKLELPVGIIHHKHSWHPLLSFNDRRFSLPLHRTITGRHRAFRVASSLVDQLSVDDGAEASQIALPNEIKTR